MEETLVENAKEYYRNALDAEKKGDYNTSVTLFFKTISGLADLYIYRKEKIIPSSHTDRFRILEAKYKEIYKIVDRNFPVYQESYRAKLNLQFCEVLKEDAEQLFRILEIKI